MLVKLIGLIFSLAIFSVPLAHAFPLPSQVLPLLSPLEFSVVLEFQKLLGLEKSDAESITADRALESVQDARLFILAQQVKIEFQDVDDKNPSRVAAYDRTRRRVLIRRADFVQLEKDLIKAGIPRQKIPYYMAVRYLPVVVHEVQHGMTRHRILQTGFSFNIISLEDEMISYLKQVEVADEILARDKNILGKHIRSGIGSMSLGPWETLRLADGLGSLEKFIRDIYEVPSILKDPLELILARLKHELLLSQIAYRAMANASGKIDWPTAKFETGSDEEALRDLLSKFDFDQNKMLEAIEDLSQAISTLEHPEGCKAVRQICNDLLSALRKPLK